MSRQAIATRNLLVLAAAAAMFALAAAAATLAFAATASARQRPRACPAGTKPRLGTARSDRIVGTSVRECFVLRSGNDTASGRGGRDVLFGGAGRDRLSGGPGADRVYGGSGRDTLLGGNGADVMAGNGGRDRISGGAGNDRINARDGSRDRVTCGAGRDSVLADRFDVVATDCEQAMQQVRRGVSVAQVSFAWPTAPTTKSTTGELAVDVGRVLSAARASSGYLNVATSRGWVVQNLPLRPEFGTSPLSTEFKLSSRSGRDVPSLKADVRFSARPLVEFASFGAGTASRAGAAVASATGPSVTARVGDTAFNGQGVGADAPRPGTPRAPTPGVLSFLAALLRPLGAVFSMCYQPGHENVQAAFNQCAPAAVANSLSWMRARQGLQIADPNVPGLLDATSLVGKLDTAMGRAATSRRVGNGVFANQILRGKLTYLSDKRPPYVVSHQGGETDAPGSANFTTGGLTSTGRGAKVTAEFIISEICKGEDVELVYRFPRGGAHIVNVTGAGRVLGVPWITYVHDHVQTSAADPRDTRGTGQTDFSFLADTDRDGRLNLANEATVPNASYVTTESPARPPDYLPNPVVRFPPP
jgi:hypothetical protein